ncbi:unnamed protein product [Meganyctiphanes norvegica]|uniref:Uncharacterized protein n=1 Tax=Meganyctiphanes norvegica TaxID=48144 RepID=A0AAV2Q8U4_MEGNR
MGMALLKSSSCSSSELQSVLDFSGFVAMLGSSNLTVSTSFVPPGVRGPSSITINSGCVKLFLFELIMLDGLLGLKIGGFRSGSPASNEDWLSRSLECLDSGSVNLSPDSEDDLSLPKNLVCGKGSSLSILVTEIKEWHFLSLFPPLFVVLLRG